MTDEEYREAVREMEKLLDHPFPLPEDDARLLELSERIHRYESARWHQGEGKNDEYLTTQAPPPPPRRREQVQTWEDANVPESGEDGKR